MIKKLLFLVLLCFPVLNQAQVQYETIPSEKLGTDRELKIQLPRNYEENLEKTYPLIIVLDGDYMFEPMAGTVDLLSYWEEMPQAIVVGVNQAGSRADDTFYDEQRFLPAATGAAFFEFLGMELLPYLDEKYRTADFVVISGHDRTANFINYYLFKESPLFQAYLNFSPELAPEMANRLVEDFRKAQTNRWFYLATSSEDNGQLRESSEILNEQLAAIENEFFHYDFDNFDSGTHFSLIAQAIPNALGKVFSEYKPISRKEYDTKIMTLVSSPYDYLTEKYDKIKEYYGMDIPIRINDFLAIGKALEAKQNWDDLEKLGDLARDHYPEMTLGLYYQARAFEAFGRPRKAMKIYQSAYGREEVAFMTIDFMLEKAELIKKDFGY